MTDLSPRARTYRALMWATAALGALGVAGAAAGARRLLPLPIGLLSGALFLICLVLAGYYGLRVRGQALADRERAARQSALVVIAAQLKGEDDDTLREIARRGGPAGEAAALLLEGRATRR